MADSPSLVDAVIANQPHHRLAEEAARLALGDLPPADFFRAFLEHALSALSASSGAVWMCNEEGIYQEQCRLPSDSLPPKVPAKTDDGALLRQAVRQARPCFLSVNGDGATPASGPGHPRSAILFAPIILNEIVEGVLEVRLDPGADPKGAAAQAKLPFLARLADLAAVYLLRQQQHPDAQRLGERLDAFARRVHGSLHPTEVAYLIANEGRVLIDCERLSVAVRQGRTAVIEAISGVERVDPRSESVRKLRRLCTCVLDWGERLIYRGVPDESLPPEVLRDLDAYLEESHGKLLIVLPLHDEREKQGKRKPRSALVLECYESAVPPEKLLGRLEEIAGHAVTALYNASSYRQVPLRFLWRPIAGVQEGLGGKTKAILAAVAAAVFILINVLIFVPYPLKLSAQGQLLPEKRHWVYSPFDGQVVRFEEGVVPGGVVRERQHLVLMYDVQLEQRLAQLQGEVAAAQQEADALGKQLNVAVTASDRLRLSGEQQQRKLLHDRKNWELQALRRKIDADPGRPGNFWIVSPMRGVILNSDFKETLTNRQVRPSEPLLRIGDHERRWEVELKIPQKHVGRIKRAFPANDPQAELDVDLLLTTEPTRVYKGKLARSKLGGEAHPNKDSADEAEPVVSAIVRIDGPDIAPEDRIPQKGLTTGIDVHAKVRCGNPALGYSLFYGLWEWFYEKIAFFF